MEKKAKIVRTVFVSEWNNPKGGQIYYHKIELDNGDTGQIGSKEKMPAKLNPGQELHYTIEATDKGNKIKAVMPVFAGDSKPGGGRPVIDPRAQFIGFSASYAKDLVIAGKVDLKDMNLLTERIFDNMAKLYETIK
jgi:hypothetical protein